MEYVSLLLLHCCWVVSLAHHGCTPSLTCLFWLTYLLKPLFFASLAQLNFSSTLALLTTFLHRQASFLDSSQDICPCFHCLSICFLPISLISRSQLCWSLSFLFYPTSGLFLQTIHGSSGSTEECGWLCQKPFLK